MSLSSDLPWTEKDEISGNITIKVQTLIVGAGAGGLNAAVRLRDDSRYEKHRILVIDAAPRPGGRLHTLRFPFSPFNAEIGGMRFLSHQRLLLTLLERYNIHFDDKNPKAHKGGIIEHKFNTFSYFLRGHSFPSRSIRATPLGLLKGYAPQQAERSLPSVSSNIKEPGELIIDAITKLILKCQFLDDVFTESEKRKLEEVRSIIKRVEQTRKDGTQTLFRADDFNAKQWKFFKANATFPIHSNEEDEAVLYRISQLGFYDILQEVIGDPEVFRFITDGLGYWSLVRDWNCADAIPWFLLDFGGESYYTLKDGLDTIISMMVDEFIAKSRKSCKDLEDNSPLLLNCKLRAIRWDSREGPYEATITAEDGVDVTVICDSIILAVGSGALKKIRYPAKENEHMLNLCSSISQNSLEKIFIWFKNPWWEHEDEIKAECHAENLVSGIRSFTDLPFRQLYLFGTKSNLKSNSKTPGDFESTGMMMIYCDYTAARYWKSLNNFPDPKTGERRIYCHETLHGYLNDNPEMKEVGGTELLRLRLKKQMTYFPKLGKLMSKDGEPLDTTALFIAFKDWSDEPFYAGWHTWKAGIDSEKIKSQVVHPFGRETRIYVCGEAFSNDQGWVEGALKTSERVLQVGFGIHDIKNWRVPLGMFESFEEYCMF